MCIAERLYNESPLQDFYKLYSWIISLRPNRSAAGWVFYPGSLVKDLQEFSKYHFIFIGLFGGEWKQLFFFLTAF